MRLSAKDRERFLSKFSQRPGQCWLWRDAKTSHGYGQFSVGGREDQKKCGAHVLAYWLFIGPVPDGFSVCHSCDRRACCNPDHLFLGTHQDNMDDMKAKGRAPKSKGARKLTDQQVEAIRCSSLPLSHFAKLYQVSKSTVSYARNRRTFTELS